MGKTLIVGLALTAVLALPVVARAHEGHAHKVMGTVSAVSDKQVEIKTTDGKTVTVALDAKTVYRQGKAKADAGMLRVGERVVVEAEQAKGATVMAAKMVQMAAMTSRAAAHGSEPHAH